MRIVRILLGNSNSIFSRGIRSCLLDRRDCVIVGEACTKQQIFTSCQKLQPELLTLGADEDCQYARELFKSFKKVFSGIKILFFINTKEEKYCKNLLKLSA